MFYSHQLLARKAPLGQIWRAATMHAKINRKNLNKLNIINICEEILNPSVPMALRLSGILMGGVVIVYERKVKLLYEDVTRLLVEINEAWKVKAKRDPTLLPKGKSQAKYEAVTLPDNQPAEISEFEQHLQFSNSDTLMGMHKSSYFEMNFDNIDDSYIIFNQGGVGLPDDHHQADIENITIFDGYNSHQTDVFNRFERFDIEGDDMERDVETQEKFPSHTHSDLPNTLVPSPPRHDEPQKRQTGQWKKIADEIQEQHPGDHINHQSDEDKARNMPQMQKPSRKRARRPPAVIMDYEQTMIPGQMYQSWLQDTSDIVSRRGRKRKQLSDMRSIKIDRLMDQPPVALLDGLFINGNIDIYYPHPLLQQWIKLTQPVLDSPSGETSPQNPPAASSSSPPPETNNFHEPTAFPFEDHHSGVGSGSLGLSREKLLPMEHEMNASGANGPPVAEAGITVTPANSGDGVESGLGFMSHGSDVNSGWPHKKKLFSSSRRSGSLEPVAEEFPMDHTKKARLSSTRRSGSSLGPMEEDFPMDHTDTNFKIIELPENELAPETDLMVETGPTQTQKVPVPDQPMEQLTNSIRMQLKTHFDTPGSTQTESLNQLALGLDRKKAACLFYQTCVLATRDYIKVQQMVAYGNILISRGSKM